MIFLCNKGQLGYVASHMEDIRSHFLPRIASLTVGLGLDEEVGEELKEAVKDLKLHIDKHYKRPEGQYSKVRKLIAEAVAHTPTNEHIRSVIKMSKDEYDLANKALNLVVQMKNCKQTVISSSFVHEVVDKVRPCASFADKFVFLQLASGARKIELLDEGTSVFEEVPYQRRLIKQVGFAKKKDSALEFVVKPLLWMDCWDFLRVLGEVREEVKARGKSGRQSIAKSFSTQLQNMCKHLWPQHCCNGYRTGTHLNRAIYANVAYHFRKTPGESLTHFIKHQLGHDSMGSAANYMNVAIAFAEDEQLQGEAGNQEVPQDIKGALFQDQDGEDVFMDYPPVQRISQEARHASIWAHAEKMNKRGVAITRANLMKLGFQSDAIKKSEVLRVE